MVIFCIVRLLLSIFIGLIFGFLLAALVTISDESIIEIFTYKSTCPTAERIAGAFATTFLFPIPITEFIRSPDIQLWITSLVNNESGPYNALLIVVLLFYHFKLAIISRSYYFVILFPIFICYTCYNEWFCFDSTNHADFINHPLITEVFGVLIMNEQTKRLLNDKFSSLKMLILDFAGDKEYLAYHHVP